MSHVFGIYIYMEPRVSLKIRLIVGFGSVVATAAGAGAMPMAFAQSQPVRSQKAVEQELALVATQMTDNPNSFANSILIAAEAHGLTLSLHFRLKPDRDFSVEQYGAEVTSAFCQNTTMRQYTDQHGVVLDVIVDAANGSGSHRFQIDRAACSGAPVSGPPTTVQPAPGAGAAQARGSQHSSTFDFKGVPLGISLDEFRRLPHPDGKPAKVVCTGEKTGVGALAQLEPTEVMVVEEDEHAAGVRKCVWISLDRSAPYGFGFGDPAPLGLAGSGYATIRYSFSFVPDPADGVPRLYSFTGTTNTLAMDNIVEAITAKFGMPRVLQGSVQNGFGAKFSQTTDVWATQSGSLTVQSPAGEVGKMGIVMLDKRLADVVDRAGAARRATIPNGI